MTGKIDSEWRNYAERVIPSVASDVQRRECRLAFYGGAMSLFSILMNLLEEGEEPTDADLGLMDALNEEMLQFAKDVEQGRA